MCVDMGIGALNSAWIELVGCGGRLEASLGYETEEVISLPLTYNGNHRLQTTNIVLALKCMRCRMVKGQRKKR